MLLNSFQQLSMYFQTGARWLCIVFKYCSNELCIQCVETLIYVVKGFWWWPNYLIIVNNYCMVLCNYLKIMTDNDFIIIICQVRGIFSHFYEFFIMGDIAEQRFWRWMILHSIYVFLVYHFWRLFIVIAVQIVNWSDIQ